MRKHYFYIVIFIIGIVAGMCLCRSFFPKVEVDIQKDTVVTFSTRYYSPLELKQNTYKLELPGINNKEYVYISEHDTTIVYRDSVRYITLPREYYHTKTDDAEIWHSGVDSRIDSLLVYQKHETISSTKTIVQNGRKMCFSLDLGCDVGKSAYAYVSPNVSASVGLRRWSLTGEVGCNLDIHKKNVLVPSLYYQVGLKYSLVQR